MSDDAKIKAIEVVTAELLAKLRTGDIQAAAIVFHDGKEVTMCSTGDLAHASGLLSMASHRCAIDAAIKIGEKTNV
jgi:hypothetical protein